MSRWCLGLVLVVSWWLLGGFCRVSVVSWWSCGAAAAETTAKIGSNKKRETVLLGLYAGLILVLVVVVVVVVVVVLVVVLVIILVVVLFLFL